MPSTKRAASAPGATVEPHRCGVLVVDDDGDVRELLKVALTGHEYRVAGAPDGREALHYLRSHADICFVLLDLMLPIMDGASFRQAQLRDRSLAWIPVVVMSAAVDADRRAREIGARARVRKPLDLDEVRQTLRVIGCAQARPQRWGG
jgi:two-component system, chemotaxis family, chemotaxis protein CheY